MKKNININPIGLKGRQIDERMRELMGISNINENENKSKVVVELTKMGPDGKAYAIIRENHLWFIKSTDKTTNIVAEDFKYIGGLQNKTKEAYPSYAKAIKHLNLAFTSLAEAYNSDMEINTFIDDNLLTENGLAGGFSDLPKGGGFSGQGNLDGNSSLFEEEEVESDSDEFELTEEEAAVNEMTDENYGCEKEVTEEIVNEHKLSIARAIDNLDAIIDNLTESRKKKVITL